MPRRDRSRPGGVIVIAFGPVPSRRLGRSLGINNIPPKICSYSCVYCQLGRTDQMQVRRQAFYEPHHVLQAAQAKVAAARRAGEAVDYLAFVPDGEPTLDIHLGREIAQLKQLDIPIAVISNASLIGRPDVRQDLAAADWVSLKFDAVDEPTWLRANRPHRSVDLDSIRAGALTFAAAFRGELVTETLLVAGVNDGQAHLRALASYLGRLQPAVAYLSIATRPPAEDWVQIPGEAVLNQAFQILSAEVPRVEYLAGYEGDAFAFTGDVEEDLLSITAVHPMRKEAVGAFLTQAGAGWATVRHLVAAGRLVEVEYEGHTFYLRSLNPRYRAA
jgi:wyosine [tRNA(Phe)-imidazoG37] synthetase (radical SAM superfamily)